MLRNAGEVRVVLEQEKHALFDRDGNSADLHHTAKISVLESLVGCAVAVKSLSGKAFNVPITDVVSCVPQQLPCPAQLAAQLLCGPKVALLCGWLSLKSLDYLRLTIFVRVRAHAGRGTRRRWREGDSLTETGAAVT